MEIVMPWQKHCPECMALMEPEIYANPEIDPRVAGNPWSCKKCQKLFVCRDGKTYSEHVEMIREHYMGESEALKVMFEKRAKGLCPTCGDKINPNGFRDDVSRREFDISGMCQNCQDKTFGGHHG